MTKRLSRSDRDRYKRLISPTRFGKSSLRGNLSIADVFASDRSRIIYSSAFRRLQQKTQVFSLSKNAAVRSRLTHTLEVANIGKLIARHLAADFLQPLGEPWLEAFVTMVETGCLMHDIGNPPFGHFAEIVVQRWFEEHWHNLYKSSVGERMTELSAISMLSNDFLEFDGNPQGIRIVTRLQGRTEKERQERGMNLTFSQVLTGLKYLRSPSEPKGHGGGKPGFFESEADRIKQARDELGVQREQRFPISYIVEAADDIAYCLSDIEDGIEHNILSAADFFRAVNRRYRNWTGLDSGSCLKSQKIASAV